MKKIYIFDTTLRDGEQSPGFSMSVGAKLNFAKQLAKLNVDAIEAGFPVSSPAQFEAVQSIARHVKGPRIIGLARTVKKDIQAVADAVKYSQKSGIHTFIATSDIHMKRKLKKTPVEVIKMTRQSVRYAKKLCDYVEFSAEDATRSKPDFLLVVVREAIKAGASAINIPDTVGYAVPSEFGKMIKRLVENIPELGREVILSVHCHNDLGLAVSNSLEAINNGANQIECTVNGIGERAGNASLEEIVMTLNVRKDYFKNIKTDIKARELYPTSKLLVNFTGIPVQPNKAIVGDNAFAHESGVHQDGMIKSSQTYEIMRPEQVGRTASHLILGRHSGRHGLKKKISEMGYRLSEKEFQAVYQKFLEISDKKREIYDDDLIAILNETRKRMIKWYQLHDFHIVSGKNTIPTATVCLVKEKEKYMRAAWGDGPVDAVYTAINKIVRVPVKLQDYSIKALSSGEDAMGIVNVTLGYKGQAYYGSSSSTDIIEASAQAYLNALNRIVIAHKL